MSDSSTSTETLDRLLVKHLDTLDLYMAEYQTVETHLKKAFFDLARARVALGSNRVGKNSYDLTPKAAIKRACIISSGWNDAPLAPSDGDTRDIFSLNNYTYAPPDLDGQVIAKQASGSPSDFKDGTLKVDQTSQGLLRRRKATQLEKDNTTDDAHDLTTSPEPNQQNEDPMQPDSTKPSHPAPIYPIHQFSAFPPPSLKAAETGFSTALECIIRVLNVRHQLNSLESAIELQKSRTTSDVF